MGNGIPAPAAPVAPVAPAPVAAPIAAAPWYGDLSADADLKGWAELKAFKDPASALKSARESERLIGVPRDELLRLPKADARPEDWNPVWDRLGRPAKAEDYKIEAVEGGEEFATHMKGVFHAAGVPQSMVDKIAPAWNAYIKETNEAQARAQEQREQLDLQTLHREWPGETFTQREEMARRAVREFVTPIAGDNQKTTQLLGEIEDAIGTASFLKLFSNIGEKVGEGKFAGGDRPTGFGMTPAAAGARLNELKMDKEFGAKIINNPAGPERAEWDRLIGIAAQAPKG